MSERRLSGKLLSSTFLGHEGKVSSPVILDVLFLFPILRKWLTAISW
jgi:hypothetical protein